MPASETPAASAGQHAATTHAMAGNGQPGSSGARRNTIAVVDEKPRLVRNREDENDEFPPFEKMKFPWSSPSSPTSLTGAPPIPSTTPPRPAGHRRSVSGSIFSKFNFLRSGGEPGRPPSREKELKSPRRSVEDEAAVVSPAQELKEDNAPSNATQSKTARKRKGSLRKTALLGGRRFATEGRERKNSLLQRNPSKAATQSTLPDTSLDQIASEVSLPPTDDFNRPIEPLQPESLRRQFSYESSVSGSSTWSEPIGVTASRLSILTDTGPKSDAQATAGEATLSSPLDLKSPVSQTSYASTTDDDDALTFDRPAVGSSTARLVPPPAATSYFPGSSLQPSSRSASRPHRSRPHRPSPLTRTPIPSSHLQDDPVYTYAETEYWGWVLLATTWIVFTVGMGSCLDVWSWAWDVGGKPYAPPELEDDPTLPIVGYYPALIVLTGGVVSWIWITVAWVGLKYFRHAKSSI
jgi:hypothetical protein